MSAGGCGGDRVLSLLKAGKLDDAFLMSKSVIQEQGQKKWLGEVDMDGRVILQVALTQGADQLVGWLLESGFDELKLTNFDSSNWTSLHQSASKGNIAFVELILNLLRDDELNKIVCPTKRETTPLHLASSKGYVEIVIILLSSGSKPSHRDKRGQTSLHRAAAQGHIDVLEVLCTSDSSTSFLNAKDSNGDTALHLWRSSCDPLKHECVKNFLIGKGALNLANDEGELAFEIINKQ